MKSASRCINTRSRLAIASLLFLGVGSSEISAATLWTGPDINFTQSGAAESDVVVAGKVVLTRGSRQVLYNTAAGEFSAGATSPKDTEWAFGTLSNFSTLTYQTLESLRNGNLAAAILNQPMVVHLINEDIYLSVKFTAWGQHGAGGFSYTRSTAATVLVAVNITRPTNGAVYAAPANVLLTASAGASGATVTNVEYFAGGASLGNSTVAPFSVDASNLAAGDYTINAVATAGGVSVSSSSVSISVVTPAPTSLASPVVGNGAFSFSYSATPGLRYVVQRSSDFLIWVPVVTNFAASDPVRFSENSSGNPRGFYRVDLLPNP